jgi:NAD(P)-dependent dehydrogenase (short-subunit alcohol dehydrogenase family)
MSDLTGKTALVTGGSRGLGRAIATRLAANGALTAVHYGGNERGALETVAEIERAGGTAFTVGADLATAGGVDRLVDGLTGGLAGRRLDVLVNNAGVFTGTFEETTPEEFDHAFAVNVRSLFFLTQRLVPLLADGGRVINMSSGVTRLAIPQVVYQMTKAAVDVLGRSLAMLLGPRGITVNTVQPGVTETYMNAWLRGDAEAAAGISAITALGRPGQPTDIAGVVSFLASADAGWVTGHALETTGGFFLGPNG